jgi:hypothetical protein
MEKPLARESGIVRVIASSPEEERAALRHFSKLLREQPASSFERAKTPNELATVDGLLQHIPEFVTAYGALPVTGVSAANFHFVDTARLPDEERDRIAQANIGGLYDFRNQSAAIVPDDRSLLVTAHRVLHELLHFESFVALQATPDAAAATGATSVPRRIGFSVFNKAHTRRFFRDFDEAMIEMLAARFDDKYFTGIPTLTSELDRRKAIRGLVARASEDIAAVVSRQGQSGQWETVIEEWRYKAERERLQRFIDEVYTANTEEFASKEDVLALLARAVFTGKLLDVARITEKTFGPGSFRELGQETMLAE